ncbi:MAG: hypothetical protein ACE5FU_04725 [Nitrospinota bacterium]
MWWEGFLFLTEAVACASLIIVAGGIKFEMPEVSTKGRTLNIDGTPYLCEPVDLKKAA